MKGPTRFLLLAAAALGSASPLAGNQPIGLDPSREISQYAHRAWTKRDGLPQNTVGAIAQTPDGYLWFGTFEGLARFDGSSFRVFNSRNTPALKMNIVSALHVARDSTMYIGTFGSSILLWRRGDFKRVAGPSELEHMQIHQFCQDRAGDVWAAGSMGLIQIRKDSVRKIFTVSDGLPHNVITAVQEDFEGRLLVATPAGIWVRQGDCFDPWMKGLDASSGKGYGFAFPVAGAIGAVPTDLIVGADSSIWIGTRERGLFRYHKGKLQSLGSPANMGAGSIMRLLEDRRGTIWIGTAEGGLARYRHGRFSTFTPEDGLSGGEVMSLFEDREGNLWVGVSTAGVNRFTNSKFTTFRVGKSVSDNMIWAVGPSPSGSVLASTASGMLFGLKGQQFLPAPELNASFRGVARAFLRDRGGSMWIGSSEGLLRISGREVRRYAAEPTFSLTEDRFGRIWGVGSKGAFIVRRGTIEHIDAGEKVLNAGFRQILYDNRLDVLWLVSTSRGVVRMQLPPPTGSPIQITSASLRWFHVNENTTSGWVMTVSLDSMDGVWVTTVGAGFHHIRGDSVHSMGAAEGLPEEGMFSALQDDQGWLWMSSNNGIHRVRVDDLATLFRGRRETVTFESFGISDGMYSDECNGGFQSSSFKTSDGRLWFPTTAGVVMVDPNRLAINTVPPAVAIEHVRVDNLEGVLSPGADYPPGNGDLEFHFIALSYSSPERVRYRYMLEGFNRNWVDAQNRSDAFYTNIPPGSYRFRVIAANGSGVWNEAGASYAFRLRPHFYQTVWFFLLLSLGLAGIVVAGMFLYKRDRDRELQASQVESQLAQAQIQILEMQLQPHFLFNTLNGIMVLIRQDPDSASRMIARLSDFLRLTLESAGIQEVPLRRELEFLDRYLQIERLRFGDRLHVVQDVSVDLMDALVPNLILQPLVENAIRHGVSKRRGASQIAIAAERTNGSLTIHVRDNGVGMTMRDGQAPKEGIGLRNTRQRLQHLYGRAHGCTLVSLPQGGVDVILTIPFHKNGTLP